jgi:hypothetical protein
MVFIALIFLHSYIRTPAASSTIDRIYKQLSSSKNAISNVVHLHGFHVQHFCDSALHDQKVRIVHVDSDHPEKVGNSLIGGRRPVDLVCVSAIDDGLKGKKFNSIFSFPLIARTWRRTTISLCLL